MKIDKSKTEFERAYKVISGGVNSPVRAFKSVKGTPLFIKKANGSKIEDIDGNIFIDFVASWGPMILGHTHPIIIDAITEAAKRGTSYGAPTIIETEMAEQICKMVPSVEKVRMVNSGTEATMSAIRLARGYTKKDKIIKFAGCYHGHGDSFLIKAGSGAITLGLPDSPGVTQSIAKDTLTANYNDLESVEKLFVEHKNSISSIIVEPVAGNMGVVKPAKGFLEGLREITKKYNALLIFDEVITGFRLAKGGAQEYYNIVPDITTLGKIIGGGLPVGAYGGRKDLMDLLAPVGPVYQAGTLSGNPLAMNAGLATLKYLNSTPDFYKKLNDKAEKVEKAFIENLKKANVKGVINRVGSMMTLFFNDKHNTLTSFDEVMTSDKDKYAKFFHLSLEAGIYLAPSQFESMFISEAHSNEDLEKLIKANLKALEQL
ncbi:MAG: glutamate-1-semialdehyde-2,1-aminomutase [Bacteroidetes bacterium CG_4_10_14_3_um_filter_31_20]|nr:MAG: glutamate-1-semialdehyde-2,1-aminomutase [Bacteroidetes bacterium CG_4_8_14_3_um_filter_31_14]PIY02898.1 MAG: glutamate-1-semialdehyde-2,1-aminomutase [Bacteroidetes bacterium CG_4_10_14_3_um_filter_31_20]